MPLFFQNDIDADTRLAVWKIEEEESFFIEKVPLHRQITHPHKRLQHLAGRYLLQYLFPHFPIGLIQIADTRKPFLEDEAYHFSISHCADYAAVIVSKTKRVGIDIEVPTDKVARIKNKFLHPEELAVMTQNAQMEMQWLTLMWCGKEAVFKWWSYGNVDFSEMIRLQPFQLQPQGNIEGAFIDTYTQHYYTVQYRLFPNICMAWITTER